MKEKKHYALSSCGRGGGYCDDTQKLRFDRRKEIAENLCYYFNTKAVSRVFVVDEADKDRGDLEAMFSQLTRQGHKITIEYDSAKKRARIEDEMYLRVLKAGKKLTIHGVPIAKEEDFWRWRKSSGVKG